MIQNHHKANQKQLQFGKMHAFCIVLFSILPRSCCFIKCIVNKYTWIGLKFLSCFVKGLLFYGILINIFVCQNYLT